MTQLTSFVLDIRNLSQSEIEQKYGSFFLTHYIEDDEMDDSWSFQTNSVSNSTVSKVRDLVESGLRLNADAHRFVAFPVQKNPRVQNPWTDRISVGRARNNDIFIRDSSVSKLHCYFTNLDDNLVLQDAGSRNGTMVNSEILTEKKTPSLKDGDDIMVGKIGFKLLSTQSFCEFIRSKTLKPEGTEAT